MNRLGTILFLGATLLVGTVEAQPIVPHPDRLRYAPFTYTPPSAKDYRVVLPTSKVPAYVAVHKELPLIQIQVQMRVGDMLDPPGKEGLASMTTGMLPRGGTDGKKSYDAQALEERLAFLAANLSVDTDDVDGEVSLNLLAKDLDEGLTILRDVLSAPHFDEKRLQLRKEQTLAEMRKRNDDAADIEQRERHFLSYGEDHFTSRLITKDSLDRITRAELLAFHRKYYHPANFVVSAAGDFDRDVMIKKLDALFSAWPYQGEVVKQEVPTPKKRPEPGVYLIHKEDVTQGRVSVLLPGIRRDNPDYFAIQVMNQILGGGGFISRITNRVRSDEGLAYAAGSRFGGGVYYPSVFLAAFQSKLRSCGYATSIVLDEIAKMRQVSVTKEEITTAKRMLIEALAQRFRTKASMVDVFLDEEVTGRFNKDPEYFRKYQERIEAITEKEVLRVADKYLDEKKVTILVVGKRSELLNPDPRHPVSFEKLASGLGTPAKIVELPLRDPLTGKPMK